VQHLAYTVPVPGCRHKTEHCDVQCLVSVWIADCWLPFNWTVRRRWCQW